MIRTIKCHYHKGVFKPDAPLPKRFDKANVIAVLDELGTTVETPLGDRFCGVWEDDRAAASICREIREHRSGYGGRKVDL